MRKYLFIGCGGFLGALSRCAIKLIPYTKNTGTFPLSTLLINITGCFLLAFTLTITLQLWRINTDVRNLLTVGFFGSYTTFSTFSKEIYNLILAKNYVSSGLYMSLSIILGLVLCSLGIAFAEKLSRRTDENPHFWKES